MYAGVCMQGCVCKDRRTCIPGAPLRQICRLNDVVLCRLRRSTCRALMVDLYGGGDGSHCNRQCETFWGAWGRVLYMDASHIMAQMKIAMPAYFHPVSAIPYMAPVQIR